jgi:tetratricopeptide (TPR) repeat protein
LNAITKAISIDPKNTLFYDNRSYLWRKLEKFPFAIEDYNKILLFTPDNIKALINRAFCFAKIEDFESAVKDYSNVLRYECNNTHALYNRAISYDKLGKINEVIFILHRLSMIFLGLLN